MKRCRRDWGGRHRRVLLLVLVGALALAGAAAGALASGFVGSGAGHPAPEWNSAPPAPVLIQKPSNPTESTSAHFRYTDAWHNVTFRCQLDAWDWDKGGDSQKCGGEVEYKGLQPGKHTFCVRAVDGDWHTSWPTCFTWWIILPHKLAFSIAGSGEGLLYPGGQQVPVNLVLGNPNSTSLEVTRVTATVTGTSVSGCTADNFVVAHQLAATPTLPAHATLSLAQLHVPVSSWPQLRMLNTATNQNVCRNATVTLSFSGTGVPAPW